MEGVSDAYRILILTDHSGHSQENSVYALSKELSIHSRCARLDIASRGNSRNDAFFVERSTSSLWAAEVGADFDYDPDGNTFVNDVKLVDVTDYDIIFMRLPRPVSDNFLKWLEKTANNAVFINRPGGIIKTSNKRYLLHFPDLCPPIAYCKSVEDVLRFADRFPIVLKPLREYGGKGILKINGSVLDDGNAKYDTETYLRSIKKELEADGYLAMKFLKNVNQGDKRIIVVGGEILASSLRLPAEDSWLCNVAQGGTSVPSQVSDEEIVIVKEINDKLESEGILIYGVDTLVDDDGKRVLSEINTLSIGGFPQSQEQSGKPIIRTTIDKMIKYTDRKNAYHSSY